MATADQILSLIRNHVNNDDTQFRKVALQISAVEARNGHAIIARTIQELLRQKNTSSGTVRLVSKNKEVDDLLLQLETYDDIKSLILSNSVEEKLDRIIKEYLKKETLRKYGLVNRRKLLLYGASGTGKTMTASVLAKEFNLPFFVVRTEKVVTKFMGETGQKLGRIFDFIDEVPAVYLFDEFDAIGSQRGMDNEVGEQRRILNTFLQLLERDDSDSFIIAATNSIESIDKAMFRRFDDVIEYNLPDREQRLALLHEYLYTAKDLDFASAEPLFEGMSHAEIKMLCSDIFKESLLNDKKIDFSLVQTIVNMRHQLSYQIS
ncbi:ATP-binding protein [Prevotella scopos JCM 17725]|uniref:ATPase family associated with various cellular activities (AAA) n=1 Tax=Prevotella scopos JCM 17725 TaxID=1236518 RepID=A0AAX2F3D7_9BACT|nr:ATP-binding protein [Prevotella scopos]ANR72253.1 AAA family ATPase [Prevotella scopos JCM 17725]QUB45541.1 ATP-binding protein [Prevotella scopos JCM 17725]SHF77558.1 ATPase family associated with various cellular activities (AAA) [Prevotella scopos JCM 17725]